MMISSGKVQVSATPHAKRKMGAQFYGKGTDFIRAAILLRGLGRDEYVVLQLLCQGIELVMKGLLLVKDYDKYQPKLGGPRTKGSYGHDLLPLAEDALAEFNLKQLQPAVLQELRALNGWYSGHLFRYGLLQAILINPTTIQSHLVLHRIFVAMRPADRHLKRAGLLEDIAMANQDGVVEAIFRIRTALERSARRILWLTVVLSVLTLVEAVSIIPTLIKWFGG